MINFKPLDPGYKDRYNAQLRCSGERGCEYSFTNLYLWGRQRAAEVAGNLVIFSQFNRKSVYLFPVGCCEKKDTLDAIIADSKERGIPCRLNGLTQEDYDLLERLYPGWFTSHFDRDAFDYVYAIEDLAELRGRKFQRKRNHLNRFRAERPDHRLEPITEENIALVESLVEQWYARRMEENPHSDYYMEQVALKKALQERELLGMEGLLLRDGDQLLAMTMGSRLSETTFDIHFEKALDIADGTYAAINQGFAAYLREKYPDILWLNREEDMGLEGLRKAKLSYNPHHMIEKSWALLQEEGYDY